MSNPIPKKLIGSSVKRRVALGTYQGYVLTLKLHESMVELSRLDFRPVKFPVKLGRMPTRAMVYVNDPKCIDALRGVAGAKDAPGGVSLLLSSREYSGLKRFTT